MVAPGQLSFENSIHNYGIGYRCSSPKDDGRQVLSMMLIVELIIETIGLVSH